jgi:hypothetical protein
MFAVLTAVSLSALTLSACGGGASQGSGTGGRSGGASSGSAAGDTGSRAGSAPDPSSGPSSSAGLVRVGGEAYSIGVPSAPAFVTRPDQVRSSGARVKFWVYDPAPGDKDRGRCFVEAVEQARFGGDFPQVSLLLFAQPEPPDRKVLRNAVMKPAPPGTVAAVDQEATMPVRLLSGRTIGAHQWQREYLLPDRTLISVTVTVPEDEAATCRAADIAASLRPTGRSVSSAPATAT